MSIQSEKLQANIAAIETVLRLGKESPNLDERFIIQKYSGFGDLKCVLLDPQQPEQFAQSEWKLIPLVQRLHDVIRQYVPADNIPAYMDSLKTSTLTSFYTPTQIVKAIDRAFQDNRYFFDNMLDPSAGMGVFSEIKAQNHTIIEKDILTRKMVAAMYPNYKVLLGGFEDIASRHNSSYNFVSSNIPFADIKVFDPAISNSKVPERRIAASTLHTYFFEKGLDVLKDGGILAFITSTGVMDAPRYENFRKHLLQRAHLISAVRLPENTFEGTKAQSDLVILQKHNHRFTQLSTREKLFCQTQYLNDNGLHINALYADGYKNCIYTDSREDTNMYGNPDVRFVHSDGVNGIVTELDKILLMDVRNIDRKLFNRYNQVEQQTKQKPIQLSLFDTVNQIKNEKPTTFEYENYIYNVQGSFQISPEYEYIGIAIEVESKQKSTAEIYQPLPEHDQIIIDYIGLRDIYFQLKNFELENQRENSELRTELNKQYDYFASNYISLRDCESVINADTAWKEILSLEYLKEGKLEKADIFFEPVAFAKTQSDYTPVEALAVCRNKLGVVNLDYISEISRLSQNDIIASLEGQIYKDADGSFQPADIFLSGNIYEKLENLNKAIQKSPTDRLLLNSYDALFNVIPAKISFHDIGINLGERWIPQEFYSQFATELFKNTRTTVFYSPMSDSFDVSTDGYNYSSREKYGVQSYNRYYSPESVLKFALLDQMPEMTKTIKIDDVEVKVEDTEGIQKMAMTIEMIQFEFQTWINNLKEDHKQYIEDLYNRTFNCFVKPHYDGKFQNFPGFDSKTAGIELYDSQKNAILMLKSQDGGIIDHEVGTGKTYIMCIASQEMKRLSLANKPLIIGLKANIQDIADTYKKAYPEAKLLYTTKEDFSPAKREEFMRKIQNNNWDCVIMTHEQFKEIPQSTDVKEKLYIEERNKCIEAYNSLDKHDDGMKVSRKALQKKIENLNSKLKAEVYDIEKGKDNVVDFKTMGIDHIFIDESHQFKNLEFQTRHKRVAGLGNPDGADRALNLKMAIRTIQQKTGRDLGATFLSGTTIANSLTELYCIFDYLRPQAMQKQGIMSFDAWASIYTKKSKELEFSVTNEIHLKERFREFCKVPELAMFYSQITDYKTAKNINIDRPEKNEILVSIEQTDTQKDMFQRLKRFAKSADGEEIFRPHLSDRERKGKMLIATNTAKKASLDMRLIDDHRFGDEIGNRCHTVADNIFAYYQKFDDQKGTQFFFSDTGTYKGKDNFSIYADVRQKLIDRGIPEKEIYFIQQATTDKKRKEVFDKANKGEIRILFGSTQTLGTGVNAQDRCVAIHHFDIPWRPTDFEQRNGRGVRHGNWIAKQYNDNKVDILIYATKQTLDTYKLNLVQNKAHFIEQIKTNSVGCRTLDEGAMDENNGLSYSEYIAVLSGNTDLLEKAKLEKQIAIYKSQERIFLENKRNTANKITSFENDVQQNEKNISNFKQDNDVFKSLPRDAKENVIAEMRVKDKVCENIREFGIAINTALDENYCNTSVYKKIGNFGSFNLMMISTNNAKLGEVPVYNNLLFIQGKLLYQYNGGNVARTPEVAGKYPVNALVRIDGLIKEFEKKNTKITEKIDTLKKLQFEFPNSEKLRVAEVQLRDLKQKIELAVTNKNESNVNSESLRYGIHR